MVLADKSDIEAFAEEVREELGERVEKIILFGSYSTGDYVPGSDIDVAILVSEHRKEDEEKVWRAAERRQEDDGLRFVPKIFEADKFESRVEKGYSFYSTVEEQGVEI